MDLRNQLEFMGKIIFFPLGLWFSRWKESGLDLELGCFCLSDFLLSVALWSVHFDFFLVGWRMSFLFQSPQVSLFSTEWQSKNMGSSWKVLWSFLAFIFAMSHSPQCLLGTARGFFRAFWRMPNVCSPCFYITCGVCCFQSSLVPNGWYGVQVHRLLYRPALILSDLCSWHRDEEWWGKRFFFCSYTFPKFNSYITGDHFLLSTLN